MISAITPVSTVDEAIDAVSNGDFVDLTNWVIKTHGVPTSKLTVRGCYVTKVNLERCLCVCECGNSFDVPVLSLKKVTSCGCVRLSSMAAGTKLLDLTGWVMKEHGVPKSLFTVIKRGPNMVLASGQPLVRWVCMCECGNLSLQTTAHLLKGDVLSCGCFRKSNAINRAKRNVYHGPFSDENGREYYIMLASNTGSQVYISAEDKCKIEEFTWSEGVNKLNGGTVSHFISAKVDGKVVRLHKALFGTRWCRFMDGDSLNYRRENVISSSWSGVMCDIKRRTYGSDYVCGVYCVAPHYYWTASIGGKASEYVFLGRFKTEEEAIKARLSYEAAKFGELAPQRKLFEKHGIKIPEN